MNSLWCFLHSTGQKNRAIYLEVFIILQENENMTPKDTIRAASFVSKFEDSYSAGHMTSTRSLGYV
jgi:hypothetical protein